MARFGAALALLSIVTTVGPACSQTANIDDVYMSLDSDGNRKRNIFFTDSKEIHCIVEAGIGREGVTIENLIRQVQRFDLDTGKTIDANRVVAQAENAPNRTDGPVKIDLALDKNQLATYDGVLVPVTDPNNPPPTPVDAPFPVGRFMCEARLDGVLKGTATFNVQVPDCPTAQILPATACYGFYPEGQECNQFGNSSDESGKCSCDKQKGWECN